MDRVLRPRRPAAVLLALLALLMACTTLARAADDASAGADRFAENCAECHSVKPGRHKKGPSLAGIVGRAAASAPDFAYSAALKASPLPWTPQRLDAYLALPKALVPGGSMKFDGLPDAQARRELIAYLATLK